MAVDNGDNTKQRKVKEPVNKHQLYPGSGKKVGLRGTEQPNLFRETKF